MALVPRVRGLEEILGGSNNNRQLQHWQPPPAPVNHLPISTPVTAHEAQFHELPLAEDREFAAQIMHTLYSLEEGNPYLMVTYSLTDLVFYIWLEFFTVVIDDRVLQKFYNLPYPIQGVSGVTKAYVVPPREGVPMRLQIEFVPGHVGHQAVQQQQHQQLLLQAPVQREVVQRYQSSESESSEESESPASNGLLNIGRSLLGIKQDAPKKARSKSRKRSKRR